MTIQVKAEGSWKPRCPLEECTHRLTHFAGTHPGLQWRNSSLIHRLSCVTLGQGLEGQVSLTLLRPPSMQPDGNSISCLCWALPLHGQMLICTGLVKSTCSTAVTPWDRPTQLANYQRYIPSPGTNSTKPSWQKALLAAINGPMLPHHQRQFRWWETSPSPSYSISWPNLRSLLPEAESSYPHSVWSDFC